MNEKRGTIKEFMRKQGYLIAAVICLMAIGIVGFAASARETAAEPEVQRTQQSQSQTLGEARGSVSLVPEKRDNAIALLPQQSEPAQETTAEVKPAEPAATPAAAQSAPTTQSLLTMPIEGNVISDFSGDKLVFNKTLNTWATHNGVDIAPSSDGDVRAAMAGTVSDTDRDMSYGSSVTVTHANGDKTVYIGLAETAVKEGDKVTAGQSLGTLGTPAFEASLGKHLHFEYVKGGSYVDPLQYVSGVK